jgi:hypothetical protein
MIPSSLRKASDRQFFRSGDGGGPGARHTTSVNISGVRA